MEYRVGITVESPDPRVAGDSFDARQGRARQGEGGRGRAIRRRENICHWGLDVTLAASACRTLSHSDLLLLAARQSEIVKCRHHTHTT